MSEQRDKDLGARLDELDVCEHGPEYWRAVMAAAQPELEQLRADKEFGVAPAASSRRRLLHTLPGRRTLWYVVAGAATAVVAGISLLVGLPGGGPAGRLAGPPPATAAELINSVLAALDGPQGLRGEMKLGTVERGRVVPQLEVAFVCARDGSQRLVVDYAGPVGWLMRPRGWPLWPTSPTVGDRVTAVYDSSSRRTQEILDYGPDFAAGAGELQDASGRPLRYMWSDYTGVAPAEPDLGLGNGPFALLRLRAYLRTMLTDSTVSMASASVDGRSVYVLRAKVITATGVFMGHEPPQPLTIVIDAATRLPLTYQWSQFGMTWEARFDMSTGDKAPERSLFVLAMPAADETLNGGAVYPGTQVTSRDWGFNPLPLGTAAEVERLLGPVAPAFPGWMPEGFARAAAAAADHGGLEGSPLNGEDIIVSLCYRRGFDQAFMSLRVDPRRNNWSDLNGKRTDTSDPLLPQQDLQMRRQWASHTTDVRLESGAYRGAVAHVVVDPSVWPHLWVKKGGLVATVAGDLTRDELVRIAESLESWNGAGGE